MSEDLWRKVLHSKAANFRAFLRGVHNRPSVLSPRAEPVCARYYVPASLALRWRSRKYPWDSGKTSNTEEEADGRGEIQRSRSVYLVEIPVI